VIGDQKWKAKERMYGGLSGETRAQTDLQHQEDQSEEKNNKIRVLLVN
jgi:bisphosphoglycerate-dependent phosphoglycerate mutase